ncbi:MAG TPA: ATP synthase F1 subunit delta, partial [Vampirovibrionales bacterium]
MQLAQEKGILNEIMADINTINSAIKESHDLELLLQSPLVKSDKKKAILQAVFNGKVSELSLTFINQVATQNRENILAIICEEFVTLYNVINNIAKVSVTTSIPLQAELREELLATLKA